MTTQFRIPMLLLIPTAVAMATPLPVPIAIHDGDTVLLDCGQIYVGTLDLSNRSNVTVTTRGDCGRATITPAHEVTGWKKNPGDPRLWSARIDTVPLQFEIDGKFMALAHHPNTANTWLRGQRIHPLQLQASLPQFALAGATLVWRATDWLIQTRLITGYDGRHIQLAPGDDEGFGLPAETAFYVEGKRWMLDTPGEWVADGGWLHVWPTDGKSPEGTAWATGRARAIDASGSKNVRIHHLKIFGATLGIDGSDSHDLHIADTQIANSGDEAILIGGRGARLQRVHIQGTVRQGIRASDDARDVIITDSRIDGAGMLGMPRRSKGAIVFEKAEQQDIRRNRITRSAYLGIRAFRQARVTDNVIDQACLRLSDCGGIYVFARDRQPLNTAIERNQITRLRGRASYAIYLDDFSNGVTVIGNQLIDNPGGMQLHNGFDNVIADNLFSGSHHEHLLFNETAPSPAIYRNRVLGNRFISRKSVPTFRLWSHHGSRYVHEFAEFARNSYVSTPSCFAEVEGMGTLSYLAWQRSLAREAYARFSVPRALPKLARQRQQE